MDGCRDAMRDATVDFMQVPLTAAQRRDFYHMSLAAIWQYSAVFAVSDTYAIGRMHFLQEQGMKIPKEISIVGFDNMGLCERAYPCLTTVGQDAYERASPAKAKGRRNNGGCAENSCLSCGKRKCGGV